MSAPAATAPPKDYEYDVCLSYASEDKDRVEKVHDALVRAGVRVFFAPAKQARMLGKNLYEYLTDIYLHTARYCVVFLSKEYAGKTWPRRELKSALRRALRENRRYILPACFDDTKFPGYFREVLYTDLRTTTDEEFADIIIEVVRGLDQPTPVERIEEIRQQRLRRRIFFSAAAALALAALLFGIARQLPSRTSIAVGTPISDVIPVQVSNSGWRSSSVVRYRLLVAGLPLETADLIPVGGSTEISWGRVDLNLIPPAREIKTTCVNGKRADSSEIVRNLGSRKAMLELEVLESGSTKPMTLPSKPFDAELLHAFLERWVSETPGHC